ncbi:hypothetical protein M8J76_014667 [Diaphorina citri]|jgi:hypothetical protein|nr:hypothetical protein M8J76_014667 [Diaphorina citri]KAI5731320.1 hypothetical protein M8J77_008200 [Diaphorina citri]
MSCGKCSLELNKEDGYIKCYGCSTRYHFQCSLSSSTWKAKSQRLKEEWRCEACREQAAIAAGKTVSKTGMDVRVSGESSPVVMSIQDSLKSFCTDHERKTSAMLTTVEKSLQTHVQYLNENMKKLFQSLAVKLDGLAKSVKSLESNQKKLLDDNSCL